MKRFLTLGVALAAVAILVSVSTANATHFNKIAETAPPDPKFTITLQ